MAAITGGAHYWEYHGLEALLACKRPLTESKDEDLFITVHQLAELTFHQMILDLDRALDALAGAVPGGAEDATAEAAYFLERVVRLYETVNRTLPILKTMRGFAEFRQALGPTSGFQSIQFRRIEIMSGVAEPYWRGGTRDAEGRAHPAEIEFEVRFGNDVRAWFERYRHHSLRWYYELLVGPAAGADRARRLRTRREDRATARLLDLLRAYEQAQLRFHAAHLAVAAAQLARVGVRVGTGGTAFGRYLGRYAREVAPLFPGLTPPPAAGAAGAGAEGALQ